MSVRGEVGIGNILPGFKQDVTMGLVAVGKRSTRCTSKDVGTYEVEDILSERWPAIGEILIDKGIFSSNYSSDRAKTMEE